MTNHHLTVAKRAATKASVYVRRHFSLFHRIQTTTKLYKEPVTKFDSAAERIIRTEITKSFPDHGFLQEESGALHASREYVWVIDPIDGTGNFASGNPLFCVSIGLLKNGKSILGVITLPFFNTMYWAAEGAGAWHDRQRLRVSNTPFTQMAAFSITSGRKPEQVRTVSKILNRLVTKETKHRDSGSCAFDLTQLAAGNRDADIHVGAKPWDVAAAICIVQEAGGVVSDAAGKTWSLTSKALVASNGVSHKQILKLLRNAR